MDVHRDAVATQVGTLLAEGILGAGTHEVKDRVRLCTFSSDLQVADPGTYTFDIGGSEIQIPRAELEARDRVALIDALRLASEPSS